MRFLQDSSIRQKLTAIVMLATFLALIVACLAFIISDQIITRNGMVEKLTVMADIIGTNSTAAIIFGIDEDASEILRSLKAEPNIITAHIHALDGREIGAYYRDNDSSLEDHNWSLKNDDHSFEADHLALTRTIVLNHKPIGRIFIRKDLTALSEHMNQYLLIMAAVFALTILITFFAIGKLQKTISGPLGHLANVARNVFERQDYSIRAEKFSEDEIGFLTVRFNEMLEDIQERDVKLHDAHEGLEKRVKKRTIELENEISKRREAEKAILQSEMRFRDVAQSISDWIWEIDAQGRYTYVSSGVEKLMGYLPEELLGKTPFDLMPQAECERVSKLFKAIVANRKPFEALENLNLTKDGHKIYLLTSGNPIINDEGKLVGYRGVDKDITEQKRSKEQKQELQEELERAQRMESLGILAGGVAHDLNNMLGPIVGYSELILMEINEDDEVTQKVKRIGKSAQEAADVIQDLLTLARRGRYEMITTDLNQIVADYIETPGYFQLTSDNPNTKINIDLDKSIGKLMGSSTHLSKVIMNLVVNAFDAMPDGGMLSIVTTQKYVEKLSNDYELGDLSGDYLLLSIADTGKGIEPEYLDKIFEPYYSKKKMGRSSGSGLGLSVVYGVLKDHKGYYDIITSPGKGTEFQLFFPITSVVNSDDKKETKEEFRGIESILIIDDNESQREVANELLMSLGYNTRTVASGEEAVEFLNDNSVDLLLLDMIMDPGMDGLDTYREIIKTHPDQKVIIASGFSATERVEKMQQLGAGQYIKKPYSLHVIGDAIRQELNCT